MAKEKEDLEEMIKKLKSKLIEKETIYLTAKILPNSSSNQLKELMENETIKISISQPAEKGKANKELIKFIGKLFETNKENVKIISGVSERIKLLKIQK